MTKSSPTVISHYAMEENFGLRMTPTSSRMRRWSISGQGGRWAFPTLFIMLLLGCSSAGSTPVAMTPTGAPPLVSGQATPPPATPMVREPRFSDIIWTSEWSGEPGDEPVAAEELRTDSPAIIALVRARMAPVGTPVDAAWTYNNTSLDAFSTQVMIGSASEDFWLAFRLDRDPDLLWPAGTYEVTLSIDGAEVASGEVQVAEST